MAAFTSVKDGNWNDGATWGKNSPGVKGTDYPGNLDTITIDHVVTYDAGVNTVDNYSTTNVRSGGVLNFPTDADSRMQFHTLADMLYIRTGGELRIGTEENPILSPFTCKLYFPQGTANRYVFQTEDGAKISAYGDSDFYGGEFLAFLKANWTTGKTFYVEGDFSTKWKPGQQLYINRLAPYSAWNTTDSRLLTIASMGAYDEEEDRTAVNIVENAPGVLFSAVDSDTGFRSHVLNISRNIEIGDNGVSRTQIHPAYTHRIRIGWRQSVTNDNIHFKQVCFIGWGYGVTYIVAVAAQKFNMTMHGCVVLNGAGSTNVHDINNLDYEDNILCTYTGLSNCTLVDNKLKDGNYFICYTPFNTVNFDADYLLLFGCYNGLPGLNFSGRIKKFQCVSTRQGISGNFSNAIIEEFIFSLGVVATTGVTIGTDVTKWGLELWDTKVWYPTSTVFSATGIYFKKVFLLQNQSNSAFTGSDFYIAEAFLVNEMVNNSCYIFTSCSNFVAHIDATNFCYAIGGCNSFQVYGKIVNCRISFFRTFCYDGKISAEIEDNSNNLTYDAVDDIFFVNCKITNMNPNIYRVVSTWQNITRTHRIGFENCSINGGEVFPLQLICNSGDILPVKSGHTRWQNPASGNDWVFCFEPAPICCQIPNRRLRLTDNYRKSSFFFSFAGEFSATFRIYPVGWAETLTGEDFKITMSHGMLDSIPVYYENPDEDEYANSGWREITFIFNQNIDGVINYNVELRRYEPNAYVLYDPIVELAAVI